LTIVAHKHDALAIGQHVSSEASVLLLHAPVVRTSGTAVFSLLADQRQPKGHFAALYPSDGSLLAPVDVSPMSKVVGPDSMRTK
jgi:hypothetical protein